MILTILSAVALLQEAPPTAPVEVLTPGPAAEPAAAVENWQRISASATRAYLVNIGSIRTSGGVTHITSASAPLTPPEAGDRRHLIDEYEIRCRSGEYRAVNSIDVPPEGGDGDAFPDPEAAWEPIPRGGLGPMLKQVACDGARAPDASYPTLAAYLESRG